MDHIIAAIIMINNIIPNIISGSPTNRTIPQNNAPKKSNCPVYKAHPMIITTNNPNHDQLI